MNFFQNSISITHHLIFHTHLAPSLNIFHIICGSHNYHLVYFFFSVPKLIEPSKKRKEKKRRELNPKKPSQKKKKKRT